MLVRTPDTSWGMLRSLEGWERGVPRSWLAELLADWQRFDVSAFQACLDRLHHLQGEVDGQAIHVVCEYGRGPRRLPLL